MGRPQVVCLEGEAGSGKSTLLSRFLASLVDAAVLEVSGDEGEALLSYGVIGQLQPAVLTEPGADPMAVGARLVDLFDQLQSTDQVVVFAVDDLQWADRPSLRAVLFALRRLRADEVMTVVSTRTGGLAEPGWARFIAGDSPSPASGSVGSHRASSPSWRPPWGWESFPRRVPIVWPPIPRGTPCIAGLCSTRSVSSI